MRSAFRVALIAALCCVSANRRATAQVALDPLAPPAGTIMCRLVPSPSGVLLQILDHPDTGAKSRDIKAGFDSAGTPVFIQVWAPEHQTGQRDRAQVFLAMFDSGGQRVRAAGDEDSLMTGTDSTRFPKLQAMTDSEVARARALALWIWSRRCIKRGG